MHEAGSVVSQQLSLLTRPVSTKHDSWIKSNPHKCPGNELIAIGPDSHGIHGWSERMFYEVETGKKKVTVHGAASCIYS
jgi:hypothetical protein